MLIMWRGWGILALIVPALFFVAGQALADSVGGSGFWSTHASAQTLTLMVAGAALLWMGRRLNAEYHESQGNAPRRHSLWFVPVEWWGVVLLVAGPMMLLGK
jgi:hypothetical protein